MVIKSINESSCLCLLPVAIFLIEHLTVKITVLKILPYFKMHSQFDIDKELFFLLTDDELDFSEKFMHKNPYRLNEKTFNLLCTEVDKLVRSGEFANYYDAVFSKTHITRGIHFDFNVFYFVSSDFCIILIAQKLDQ
jgi:hypothetical protein